MLAKSCRSQVVPDKLTDLVDDRAEDEGGLMVAMSQPGLLVSTNSQAARSAKVFEAR
jgi:hypothetical protein